METMRSIVVTVADTALDRIHEVAGQLSQNGMDVHRVLPQSGVISGQAMDLSALRNISGVLSVEEENIVRLPPGGQKG